MSHLSWILSNININAIFYIHIPNMVEMRTLTKLKPLYDLVILNIFEIKIDMSLCISF